MILKKKSFFCYFWLLMLFVVTILFGISNKSFALSTNTIVDYVNQTADYYSSNTYYQIIKQRMNQTSMQSMLSQYADNYDAIYINCVGSTSNMYVYLYTNPTGSLNDMGPGTVYIHGKGMIMYMDRYMNPPQIYLQPTNNLTEHISGCYRTQVNQYNVLIGMNFSPYSEPNGVSTYVGNGGYNPLTYLDFDNSFIDNTAYNGTTFTYYYKGDLYDKEKIKIGSIIPNDSYYFEARFYDTVQNIIIGTSYVAYNVYPFIFYNDGALYVDELNDVYLYTRYLKQSRQYRLDIVSYYGDGGSDLHEDDDWFIFLPYNASVSGDVILSLGSGDFSNQDQTIQLIDAQQQQTQDIINYIGDYSGASGEISGFFSGNVLSGDIIGGIEMPHIRTW